MVRGHVGMFLNNFCIDNFLADVHYLRSLPLGGWRVGGGWVGGGWVGGGDFSQKCIILHMNKF